MQRPRNILSVDVEDWFQVENYSRFVSRSTWPELELRVVENVRSLLQLFGRASVRATFFVLGWIAERVPELVREMAEAGHEIASHGWSHTPLWALTPDAFAEEVRSSRALLRDLSGQPVYGYRAPTFSVTERTQWSIRILVDAGYQYDSSIYPVRHDRYGIPAAPLEIHRRAEGIWEIPASVVQLGRLRVPVAGGGYLRLYPRTLTLWAIKRINRSGRPAVVYVHPWEFDPGQPHVPGIGLFREFRHHVGIRRNYRKLAALLSDLPFAPVKEVLAEIGAELRPDSG